MLWYTGITRQRDDTSKKKFLKSKMAAIIMAAILDFKANFQIPTPLKFTEGFAWKLTSRYFRVLLSTYRRIFFISVKIDEIWGLKVGTLKKIPKNLNFAHIIGHKMKSIANFKKILLCVWKGHLGNNYTKFQVHPSVNFRGVGKSL